MTDTPEDVSFTCHIDARSLKHHPSSTISFSLVVDADDVWGALPFLHEQISNQVPLTCRLEVKEEWLEDERAGAERLKMLRGPR